MKASAFSYVRAPDIDAALDLLAAHGAQAKILSGGQSLMPALNQRLVSPALIIDIGAITELKGISVAGDALRIGAATRYVDLLKSSEIAAKAPLLGQAIAHIAHPSIRNKGTIGGNLAHADPAAELPACMLALDATVIARGPNGERRIPAAAFFLGAHRTALEPQDLLIGIEIPIAPVKSAYFFDEHARRKGGTALAGLAGIAVVENDGFADLRLAFFAVGDRPLLATAARRLVGRPISVAALSEAQAALDAEINPSDDVFLPASLRRYFAHELFVRCVSLLLDRPDLAARRSA